MTTHRNLVLLLAIIGSACGVDAPPSSESVSALTNGVTFTNPTGDARTFNPTGNTDESNAFFQDLGTNGRRCSTCHDPAAGWTVRPDLLQARFDATDGTDPIFRTNDGTTSPTADVSTLAARRAAYTMLLTKGLIRVGIGIPANAQFELVAVDDPYGFASAAQLSLFRRPLPSANLLEKTVMWDGRETFPEQPLAFDLADQANGATLGHAQAAAALPGATRDAIVGLESALFVAQEDDNAAKILHAAGALGGAEQLATETFDPATNVPGFALYGAWIDQPGNGTNTARRAIARGEVEFNKARPAGRCTGCHSAHDLGSNVNGTLFDIGVSAPSRRTPDLPLYTLRNLTTGALRQTTDPGRALITGLWTDVDRFKPPTLRGLAARAPYFHDGSAPTLDAVVTHYQKRFNFTMTAQEQSDLVAFLNAL